MSSKGYAQRLEIECYRQGILRTLFVGFIVIADACLLVVPLSWSLTAFSLLLLNALALHTWHTRCELGGERASLLWDGEGRWWWRHRDVETELLLVGDTYLSTWLIALILRHPVTGRRKALLLFPCASQSELFRRLTVRLRLQGCVSKPSGGVSRQEG